MESIGRSVLLSMSESPGHTQAVGRSWQPHIIPSVLHWHSPRGPQRHIVPIPGATNTCRNRASGFASRLCWC